MHEFGITSRIVEAALSSAEENGASAVKQVDLVIGKLTLLNPEQVKFAYDILVEGTILEGSELSVEEVEGVVRCLSCENEEKVTFSEPQDHFKPLPLISCSRCRGEVEIIKGKECAIKGIFVED